METVPSLLKTKTPLEHEFGSLTDDNETNQAVDYPETENVSKMHAAHSVKGSYFSSTVTVFVRRHGQAAGEKRWPT